MNGIIVFDGQVFQTSAWDRGMGKYSLSLVDSILRQIEKDEQTSVYIVFTQNLPLTREAREALKALSPRLKHVYLDLRIPESLDTTQHIVNRQVNVKILDKFVDNFNYTNIRIKYVILSLFIDKLCEVFPTRTENILLFYDLIPLFYHKYYGLFPTYQMYLAQFDSLMSADKIMTISQTVADEMSVILGIPRARLCNIDGGPIKRNHRRSVKPESFDIPDNFVLMPTGNDIRKNNLRAVRGFEEYRLSSNKSDSFLVITSSFDDATKQDLLGYCDNLIFTGNVPEDELLWLYKNCLALLFIPESEGLGLPILEAVEVNKPIIASKIGPFLEMSENAFYYANHFSISDIADAIAGAVSLYGWEDKLAEYPTIIEKYQWERTAAKALRFIEKMVQTAPRKKPKLAILGPNPSGYSAIGSKMQQAHPALSEHFDIDYYVEKQKKGDLVLRPSYIEYIASARLVEEFDLMAYAKYDAVIYHIGNSEFHMETIKRSLYLPGYVFIHDTYLENIFSEMRTSKMVSDDRYRAETKLNKILDSEDSAMLGSILNNQLGAFVHSSFAKNALEKLNISGLRVVETVLATEVAARSNPKLSNKITIGLAGIIHPIKGLDLVKRLSQDLLVDDVQFEVFGMAMVSQDYINMLSSLPNVNVSTNLTDYEFQLKLAQLDILVNYRADYHGETSLSVIEAMRVGVVPIVHDIGWYSELPSDAVLKLKSIRSLLGVIKRLISDSGELERRSKNAKQYVENNFTYERYVDDIRNMLKQSSSNGRLLDIVTALKAGDTEKVLDIVRIDKV